MGNQNLLGSPNINSNFEILGKSSHFVDTKISKIQTQLIENLIYCLSNLINCIRDREISREELDLRNSIEVIIGAKLDDLEHGNLGEVFKFLSVPNPTDSSSGRNIDILITLLNIIKDPNMLNSDVEDASVQRLWIERSLIAARNLEKNLSVQ